MQVTVLVNEDTALALSKADHQLQDILILHLEKGKDFFISVSGNYLLSCFGSSLETLIHLHTYIREVPVATLLDLVRSHCLIPRLVSGLILIPAFCIMPRPASSLISYACF